MPVRKQQLQASILARKVRIHSSRVRKISVRRAVLSISFITICLVFLSGGSTTYAVLYTAATNTQPVARIFPADTMVYDRNGILIADLHLTGLTRIPVELSNISPTLINATLAVEDKQFWTEGAIDFTRIAAAAYYDLKYGSSSQGASTITMQLAKLLYLKDTKSLVYKAKEVLLAQYLTTFMSKQQILDEYLNDIFYGDGAQGIEAASHVFFGIPASQLDLAQASMLAGLPNQPSLFNPLLYPAIAKTRQHVVLEAMVQNGNISSAEANKAYSENLVYASTNEDNIDSYPFFVAQVENVVATKLKLNPLTSGLNIVSTLNSSMQSFAQADTASTVKTLGYYNLSDAALVSLDPQTGDVLAYVGNAGQNVPGADIDMASTPRQVGSAFKLFTYTSAIQYKKISMVTPVLDGPISIPTGSTTPYAPHDYGNVWHGVVPLEVALGNSDNIPAVRVELLDGISNVISLARAMGVTTLSGPLSSFGPSATLGTYPVPLWQMAQAASVLAAGGTLHPIQFVLSVDNAQGENLYQTPAPTPNVVTPQAAYIMNMTLSNNLNREAEFGTYNLLEIPGHTVAAKTGTSDSFKDNYTIGWTPNLLTAVWAGNTNDAPMYNAIGITGAAPIWNTFETRELQGQVDNWPNPPPGVTLTPSNYGGAPAYTILGTSYLTNETALLGGWTCSNFYDNTYCFY